MIDGLPPEQEGGALAGLAILGFVLLRWIGLRVSKDAITLKADASDRDAFSRLQKRVEELDDRLAELEEARNQMFSFSTKCMAYIAQCQCTGVMPPTRTELLAEYERLIRSLANGFHKEKEI